MPVLKSFLYLRPTCKLLLKSFFDDFCRPGRIRNMVTIDDHIEFGRFGFPLAEGPLKKALLFVVQFFQCLAGFSLL